MNQIVCFVIIFVLQIKLSQPEKFMQKHSDFPKVIKSPAYVDKSPLIKEIFQYPFILITAPRSFGKSTNMDMIKRFLEITVDENGHQVDNVEETACIIIEKHRDYLTENYKLFKDNNLEIYNERQFFYKHCGRHPVIFVNFTGLEGSDYEEVLENTRTVIQKTFAEHKYLLKDDDFWETTEKHTFTGYLEESDCVNATHLVVGLRFLTSLLHRRFNKKVFVLIDDYDAFVFDAIVNCNTELAQSVTFLKDVFSTLLKQNPHVDRGLINGRLQLERSELPASTVHFPFCGNHNFAQFYGLTAPEVETLARRFDKYNKLTEIKDFYDGYTVLGQNVKIYSVYSVVSFVKYGKFEIYWGEKGELDEFANMLLNTGIQSKMERMLNGQVITVQNVVHLEVEQILLIHRLLNQPYRYGVITENAKYADLLIQFLCETGYLELTKTEPLVVKVPNEEIAQALANSIYTVSFFKKKYNFNSLKIREVNIAIKWLDRNVTTFHDFVRSVADLFADPEVRMPGNDFDFHRAIYTFAKERGNFESVIGRNNFLSGKSQDIVIVRYDGVAVIMEVMYKAGSAYDGLGHVLSRQYNETIQREYTVFGEKYSIYLGLHLSENRTVSVSYVVDSLNITDATNLTCTGATNCTNFCDQFYNYK